LPVGTVLQAHHLVVRRPGTGIAPGESAWLIGRTLTRALSADEMVRRTDVQ